MVYPQSQEPPCAGRCRVVRRVGISPGERAGCSQLCADADRNATSLATVRQHGNGCLYSAPNAQEQPAQPFRYEFLTLRPHIDYTALYANGILAAPGQPVNTVIQEISPGLRLDIGDHWVLDYTLTWMAYSSRYFQNTLNQNAKLTGGTSIGSWVLGLTQTYSKSAVPQAQTATQTHAGRILAPPSTARTR